MRKIRLRPLLQWLLLTILTLLALGSPATADNGLQLWVHPYLPATELIQRFSPLADYLGRKIGQPVTVQVASSYQAHGDQVGRDLADIAYMGPMPFMQMVSKYGPKPLLARLEVNGSPVFYGMIVVRQDSPLQTLAELKGKKFAFGDPNSTMSHLVPKYMLHLAGIELNDLARFEFLNGHENVALAVLAGYYDAGGVKEEVYHGYRERGLRLLAKSPPVPEHLFVTRSNLPAETVSALQQAMLELKEASGGAEILQSLKKTVTGLGPVRLSDYDMLREIQQLEHKPEPPK